jgi:hypothetical protein
MILSGKIIELKVTNEESKHKTTTTYNFHNIKSTFEVTTLVVGGKVNLYFSNSNLEFTIREIEVSNLIEVLQRIQECL